MTTRSPQLLRLPRRLPCSPPISNYPLPPPLPPLGDEAEEEIQHGVTTPPEHQNGEDMRGNPELKLQSSKLLIFFLPNHRGTSLLLLRLLMFLLNHRGTFLLLHSLIRRGTFSIIIFVADLSTIFSIIIIISFHSYYYFVAELTEIFFHYLSRGTFFTFPATKITAGSQFSICFLSLYYPTRTLTLTRQILIIIIIIHIITHIIILFFTMLYTLLYHRGT